jgi:pyridoxamine 5'-phosphate oxidase
MRWHVKEELDPFARFGRAMDAASATGMRDPNATCLATVDSLGRPSTRMVLLKSWDREGFVFYTNLGSRKAQDLRGNQNVSLTFFWRELDQQIHIRGSVRAVSDAEADAYFATRPRTSQLGAWASRQSAPLTSRASLLLEVARLEIRHVGRPIPRPPHWSGFRVLPATFEFWVAGAFRLHDRTLYERDEAGWRRTKLQP